MKNIFKSSSRFSALSEEPVLNEENRENRNNRDNREKIQYNDNNVKRTNESNIFSQKVNDKALEQKKANDMQKIIDLRNKNLSMYNFPELKLSEKNSIISEVKTYIQIISFSEKVKRVNAVVENYVTHIPYGWAVIKRDPITKKLVTTYNKEYEKDLRREEREEKEQWPLKVLDALVDLYEKEKDNYIDKWGYDAYEKKYIDLEYDDEYFDRLDEEYDRNNLDDSDKEYDEDYDDEDYE
jgi:hypothetical protein